MTFYKCLYNVIINLKFAYIDKSKLLYNIWCRRRLGMCGKKSVAVVIEAIKP